MKESRKEGDCMNDVTWEEYSSLYSTIPDETLFNKYTKRALVRMNAVTHVRVSEFLKKYKKTTATNFQKQVYAQIQDTICELANIIYLQEASGIGTGVTSVSNDGYSESYAVTTTAEKEVQQTEIIRRGLRGTGLVSVL